MWWILNVKIIKDTCDFNQNYKEGTMTFPNIYDDALYEQLYWFGFILA